MKGKCMRTHDDVRMNTDVTSATLLPTSHPSIHMIHPSIHPSTTHLSDSPPRFTPSLQTHDSQKETTHPSVSGQLAIEMVTTTEFPHPLAQTMKLMHAAQSKSGDEPASWHGSVPRRFYGCTAWREGRSVATLHTFPGGGKNSAKGDVVRMESMYVCMYIFLCRPLCAHPLHIHIHT